MQKLAHTIHGLNIPTIFLLIGLAIMGGSVYFGWRTTEKVKAVAAWPTTPAYVIESRIEWNVRAHDRTGTTQRSYSYAYQLPVLAGYRVAGEYHTSATPAITTIRDSKYFGREPWKNPPDRAIVALFKRVPQGSVVPIHYNPANATEAFIFSDLPFRMLYTGNVVALFFGALVALFGLVPMLLARRYAERPGGRERFVG